MNNDNIIRSYLSALEEGVLTKILELFTSDAIIVSPLYGIMSATEFYTSLCNDTAKSRITCHDIYSSSLNCAHGAAYFTYEWQLANEQEVKFECVDIFEFDETAGKIAKVTIIYDSSSTRQAFSELRET